MFNQREISWLLDNMSGNRFNNGCSEFAASDAVVQFGKNKQIIIMMYECPMDNQKNWWPINNYFQETRTV